jgi:hypothetical protein
MVLLAAYAVAGSLWALACHQRRAAQLEEERLRLEAPARLTDACPDSLLATGCHPAWELEAWYAAEDSLQLEAERAYRADGGCAPDFYACHFGDSAHVRGH